MTGLTTKMIHIGESGFVINVPQRLHPPISLESISKGITQTSSHMVRFKASNSMSILTEPKDQYNPNNHVLYARLNLTLVSYKVI